MNSLKGSDIYFGELDKAYEVTEKNGIGIWDKVCWKLRETRIGTGRSLVEN